MKFGKTLSAAVLLAGVVASPLQAIAQEAAARSAIVVKKDQKLAGEPDPLILIGAITVVVTAIVVATQDPDASP